MYFEPSLLALLVPLYFLGRKYPAVGFLFNACAVCAVLWVFWVLMPPGLALAVYALIALGGFLAVRLGRR